MEDLLWKYIDNECTPEESEQMKSLLQSDTSLKKKYEEYLQLDKLLAQNIHVSLSEKFELDLKISIQNEFSAKQIPAKTGLFNILWVALTVLGISAILTIYLMPSDSSQSNVYSDYILTLDKETINLLNIVVVSFIFMIGVDKVLRYFTRYKPVSFIL